jgi:hypothetical protein
MDDDFFTSTLFISQTIPHFVEDGNRTTFVRPKIFHII